MIEHILFFTHGTLLLFFGVLLSCAFAGIRITVSQNIKYLFGICMMCGLLQILSFYLFDEATVWKLYPLTTHLPLLLFLCLVYHKRAVTAFASVFTAYLLCQPVKWFGILAFHMTGSAIAEYLVRILALLLLGAVILKYLSGYFARIYNKDTRSVCIFGIIPMVYYVFDYTTMIYTDLWINNNRIVAEFLPFFLGIIYMIFGVLYCSENEEKILAEHKADLIRIAAEQQKKEIESIKRNEKTIRILHHDMRLFLSSLSVCLEQGDSAKATEMLSSYIARIDDVKMKRYCHIDIINYILSDFSAKCKHNHVSFEYTIEIEDMKADENLFAPILSNALDNALNAQKQLSRNKRRVKMVMRTANHKLLLSVENPISHKPVFADGLPVSDRTGHGYGAQSIRYMTECLQGKCQFSATEDTFIVKIIL